MSRKPWDARLANRVVRPLRDTSVKPNHLTTLRLAVGLAAVGAFAVGDPAWSDRGALLLVLSNFLDHTDGELARMTGRTSRAGRLYDLAGDAVVHVLLFVAIGVGLRENPLGLWAPAAGLVAGAAVAGIFLLRERLQERRGEEASRLPLVIGFEMEDILYLMPLVTWLDGLLAFLVAATIGAPLFLGWLLWREWTGF